MTIAEDPPSTSTMLRPNPLGDGNNDVSPEASSPADVIVSNMAQSPAQSKQPLAEDMKAEVVELEKVDNPEVQGDTTIQSQEHLQSPDGDVEAGVAKLGEVDKPEDNDNIVDQFQAQTVAEDMEAEAAELGGAAIHKQNAKDNNWNGSNTDISREKREHTALVEVNHDHDAKHDEKLSPDHANYLVGKEKQEWDEPMKPKNEVEKTEDSVGDEEFQLEEDIYNIMFIAPTCSIGFVYAFLVFCTQMLLLVLIMTDFLMTADDNNKLRVPINVDMTMAASQYIAVVIAVLTQTDIFTSLSGLVMVGYHSVVRKSHPHACRASWYYSNILRFVEGLAVICVTFFFICQESNILDLFMNFAAVEFISELDNAAFWLAAMGYAGTQVQAYAKEAGDVSLPYRGHANRKWFTWITTLLILTLLMTGFAIVRGYQVAGLFLERQSSGTLRVQFGDETFAIPDDTDFVFSAGGRSPQFNTSMPPDLHYSYFSGIYQADCCYEDRQVYYERDLELCKTDPTCGKFYYCPEVESWVFTIEALNNSLKQKDKCVAGWLARSPETDEYILENVELEGWKIWTGILEETPLLNIEDAECNNDADCSLNGHCVDTLCECDKGWTGRRCDKAEYCPAMERYNYGENSKDYTEFGPFLLLKDDKDEPVLSYERPVYYYPFQLFYESMSCPDGSGFTEIYLFTGRRWFDALFCSGDLARFIEGNGTDISSVRFDGLFHAYWDDILSGDTQRFTDTTESDTGRGLPLHRIRQSRAMGNYQPFGASYETNSFFECVDVECGKHPETCGLYGSCADLSIDAYCKYKYGDASECDDVMVERLSNMTMCECDPEYAYGGHYCEFAPTLDYAGDQFAEYKEYIQSFNKTDYETNTYHELFWSHVWPFGVELEEEEEEEEPVIGDSITEALNNTISNMTVVNETTTEEPGEL